MISSLRHVEALEKVALLTGITGQDGSYLAEFLLNKGYKVHGIIRRSSSFNTGRLERSVSRYVIASLPGQPSKLLKKVWQYHWGEFRGVSDKIYELVSVTGDQRVSLGWRGPSQWSWKWVGSVWPSLMYFQIFSKLGPFWAPRFLKWLSLHNAVIHNEVIFPC